MYTFAATTQRPTSSGTLGSQLGNYGMSSSLGLKLTALIKQAIEEACDGCPICQKVFGD